MRKTFILFAIFISTASMAATCPTGYEKVHLEHMTWETNSCPAGTVAYFSIDEKCDDHIR